MSNGTVKDIEQNGEENETEQEWEWMVTNDKFADDNIRK
jgi:hypothetical protein